MGPLPAPSGSAVKLPDCRSWVHHRMLALGSRAPHVSCDPGGSTRSRALGHLFAVRVSRGKLSLRSSGSDHTLRTATDPGKCSRNHHLGTKRMAVWSPALGKYGHLRHSPDPWRMEASPGQQPLQLPCLPVSSWGPGCPRSSGPIPGSHSPSLCPRLHPLHKPFLA